MARYFKMPRATTSADISRTTIKVAPGRVEITVLKLAGLIVRKKPLERPDSHEVEPPLPPIAESYDDVKVRSEIRYVRTRTELDHKLFSRAISGFRAIAG